MHENLFIDIPKTNFKPEETISGTILWALDERPKEVRLTLGWSTAGRGSEDRKIESELKWNTESISGEESFEFQLPSTPYSFDGKLIALNWELVLSVKKGKAETVVSITLSPYSSPVALSAVKNERKRKSLSFGSR